MAAAGSTDGTTATRLSGIHQQLVAATAPARPAREYDDEGLEQALESLSAFLKLAAENAIINAKKNPRFTERKLQSANFFRFDPPVRDAGRPLQNVRWHGFLMTYLLLGPKDQGMEHWARRQVVPVLKRVKDQLGPFGVAAKWLGMDSGFVLEVSWGPDRNADVEPVVRF